VTRPRSPAELIAEIADRFGNQVLVLSIDARRVHPANDDCLGLEVTTHGGRRGTGIDAIECAAVRTRRRGDPLNSMDADGTKDGYDLVMLRQVREVVTVPVIAAAARAGSRTSRPRSRPGPMRCWRRASPLRDLRIGQVKTRCGPPDTRCADATRDVIP